MSIEATASATGFDGPPLAAAAAACASNAACSCRWRSTSSGGGGASPNDGLVGTAGTIGPPAAVAGCSEYIEDE